MLRSIPSEHSSVSPFSTVTKVSKTHVRNSRAFVSSSFPAASYSIRLSSLSSRIFVVATHLPHDVAFERVAGLGMNAQELDANRRLTDHVVHDLNREPELPYSDTSFDAVINAVSIQYLTRPAEVFRSVARVLRPGGLHLVAMSHRCFPTKAIRAFGYLDGDGRAEVVHSYFERAGGYTEPERLDRSPRGADPLWIMMARRAA